MKSSKEGDMCGHSNVFWLTIFSISTFYIQSHNQIWEQNQNYRISILYMYSFSEAIRRCVLKEREKVVGETETERLKKEKDML